MRMNEPAEPRARSRKSYTAPGCGGGRHRDAGAYPREMVPTIALVSPSVVRAIVACGLLITACADDSSPTSTSATVDAGDSGVSPPDRRPNVVLIAMESVRARAVTPYAPGLPSTPFLVDLAAEGVRVERAYTSVPHTSKALVGLQCGVPPKPVKAIAEVEPGAIPSTCLAAHLDDAGYATLFIQPARESFEDRPALVENFGFADFLGKSALPSAGFDESSYFGYEDDIMVGPALDWVDAQGEPFFLSILTLTAHHDYGVPAGYPVRDYVDDPTLNDYLNTVAYTDRFVRKIHDGLADRGLLDDTIFIVVGDHGEGFGEHGRVGHDKVIYEEGLHVPMVLKGPGIGPPGTVLPGLRQALDLPPTILRLVGQAPPPGKSDYDGRDLFETAGHERLFYSCWQDSACMAMREGDRKVIYHYGASAVEVFDLAADPLETVNVIDDGDNLAFAEVAVAAMEEWRATINARYDAL